MRRRLEAPNPLPNAALESNNYSTRMTRHGTHIPRSSKLSSPSENTISRTYTRSRIDSTFSHENSFQDSKLNSSERNDSIQDRRYSSQPKRDRVRPSLKPSLPLRNREQGELPPRRHTTKMPALKKLSKIYA